MEIKMKAVEKEIMGALMKLDTRVGICGVNKVLVPRCLAKKILKIDKRYKDEMEIIDERI